MASSCPEISQNGYSTNEEDGWSDSDSDFESSNTRDLLPVGSKVAMLTKRFGDVAPAVGNKGKPSSKHRASKERAKESITKEIEIHQNLPCVPEESDNENDDEEYVNVSDLNDSDNDTSIESPLVELNKATPKKSAQLKKSSNSGKKKEVSNSSPAEYSWPYKNEDIVIKTPNNKTKHLSGCTVEHKGIVCKEEEVDDLIKNGDIRIVDATVLKTDDMYLRSIATPGKNGLVFKILKPVVEAQLIRDSTLALGKQPQWQVWKSKAKDKNNSVLLLGTDTDKLLFGTDKGCIFISTQLALMKRLPRMGKEETVPSPAKAAKADDLVTETENNAMKNIVPEGNKRKRTRPLDISESTIEPIAKKNIQKKREVEIPAVEEAPKAVKKPTSSSEFPREPICEVKFNFCSVDDVKKFFAKNSFKF